MDQRRRSSACYRRCCGCFQGAVGCCRGQPSTLSRMPGRQKTKYRGKNEEDADKNVIKAKNIGFSIEKRGKEWGRSENNKSYFLIKDLLEKIMKR